MIIGVQAIPFSREAALRRRSYRASLFLALALTACSNGERLRAEWSGGPPMGNPLPAFEVTDLGGQPFDLSQVGGRVLVLNLWATWCFPCRDEMPELEELQASYDPSELQVVGLSVDTVDPARVLEFLEENGYTYLNLMTDLMPLLEILDIDPGIPHTFLVDREGIVQGYWRGRFRPFEPNTAARLRTVVDGA